MTVVLNDVERIGSTIESVLAQKTSEVEYVIIDGASTDGTIDIVNSNLDNIDVVISERDFGIYDAMNKGIETSTGDLVVLLNSGDRFCTGALEKVLQTYSQDLQEAIYFGDIEVIVDGNSSYYKKSEVKPHTGMSICHQAMFVHRKVYKRIGLYSRVYRLSADYDFFLNALKSNIPFVNVRHTLVEYNLDGLSEANLKAATLEKVRISLNRLGYLNLTTLGLFFVSLRVLLFSAMYSVCQALFGEKVSQKVKACYLKFKLLGKKNG